MSDHPWLKNLPDLEWSILKSWSGWWVCSAVLLISGFEKKNEVMAKRIGSDNETGGGGGKLYGRGISKLFKTIHSENPCLWRTKTTPNFLTKGRRWRERKKKEKNPWINSNFVSCEEQIWKKGLGVMKDCLCILAWNGAVLWRRQARGDGWTGVTGRYSSCTPQRPDCYWRSTEQ